MNADVRDSFFFFPDFVIWPGLKFADHIEHRV